MRKIRVLTFQYCPIYLDPKANVKKFDRLMKKYAFFKPDLAIFPEYSLTGPLYGNYDLAFVQDDEVYKQLCSLANKYQVFLLPGSFIRNKKKGKYNSTCLINRNGEILGFYDKQVLWAVENRFLHAGKQAKVFDTKLGKIAVQICADLHSSKISNDYRELKPELIINLSMWSKEDTQTSAKKLVPENIQFTQTEVLCRARSLENRAFTIFCNYGYRQIIKTKRDYKITSIGNTMVINPFGEVISKVDHNREQVLLTEFDLSKTSWSKYNH